MAEYNGAHVDHSLEMFRNNLGAGGGAGYSKGYQFDGQVEAAGSGDTAPVTERELEEAHDVIREKLQARFTSFRKAFKEIDENRSGRVTKTEVRGRLHGRRSDSLPWQLSTVERHVSVACQRRAILAQRAPAASTARLCRACSF